MLKYSLSFFIVFICLFIITGCGEKDYTLIFKKDLVLDYNSKDSPLTLIESIGGEKINDTMIKNDKIEIDNFTVECKKITTNKKGSFEVKYITNDTSNRYYTKNVIVKDISAPKIVVKEKELTLTLQEYKEYDFTKIIKVTDNWDIDEPLVDLEIEEVTSAGKYTIKIYAEDKAGNKSQKKISLTIKNEDKKTNIDGDKNPSENPNENKPIEKPVNPTVKPVPPTEQPSAPAQPNTPKPSNRDFLFVDGYTMDNVGSVCFSALQGSGYAGSCTPIKDANGIYIGMRLIFN